MADNIINLKLTIDGKEAIAALQLTDENLKSLYKSFNYGQQAASDFEVSLSQGLNNARQMIIGLKETYSTLVSLFASPVRAAINIEQAEISFSVLLGSAEKAKDMIGNLRDFAAKTPLQFSGLQENARLLLSFGTAASDILPYLRMLGDVSGGNAEKMSQLTLAFAQMQSAGRLMGQDLLQMINAGFNPLQVISEKTGKSIGELKKEMEGGAISSQMIIEAFKDATSEGGRFYQMLEKQSESLGGKLSTLEDNFDMLQQAAGGTVALGLEPLVDHLSKALDIVYNLSPELSGLIGSLGLMGAAAVTLKTTGLLPLIGNLQGFQSIAGRINLQMALAPAGVNMFQKSLAGLGATIKGVTASIGPLGWAMIGITAAVEVINLLGDSTKETTRKMSEQETQLRNSQAEFNNLVNIVKSSTASENTRKEAIKQINEKYPEYIDKTITLATKEGDLAEALKNGNEKFTERIKLAANEAVLKDKFAAAADIQKQIIELEESIRAEERSISEDGLKAEDGISQRSIESRRKNLDFNKTYLATLNSQYDQVSADAEDFANKMNSSGTITPGKVLTDEEKKKLFNEQKSILSEKQRHAEAMLAIQTDNDNVALALKIRHFEQMIELYKKFNQDTKSLENQRAETEAKLTRESAVKEKEMLKPKLQVNKEVMKTVEVDEKEHQENIQEAAELTTENKLQLLLDERQAVADSLGQTSQMFAKHTAAYQALASAQALIDTYTSAEAAYKAVVGVPFVGPALAAAAATAAIVAGFARVKEINSVSVPSATGYAEGGRLKKGEAGYIEGYHNEIIAPEKTFVDIFKNELRPQIYNGMSTENSALLNEIRNMNTRLDYHLSNPVAPIITKDAVGKIASQGGAQIRKGRF
ncbi:MAG TPA: tape measure protein [Ignavibacteriales bacterium]|nr:tape measure protein [Ignavibacteriales bacterium]